MFQVTVPAMLIYFGGFEIIKRTTDIPFQYEMCAFVYPD